MTDPRKQPGAAFWITVALVAVLVEYPLSVGPACWWKVHRPLSGQLKIERVAIEPHVFVEPQGMITLERRPGIMKVRFPLYVDPIYKPIVWVAEYSPTHVHNALQWYVDLWVPCRQVGSL